uniref:Uncharacterized protein n=1 Tax=Acrobeloides nanus TaxID=290746 RepID=A0A914ENS9_9BILA
MKSNVLSGSEMAIVKKHLKLRSHFAFCSASCKIFLEIILKHFPIRLILVHKDVWNYISDFIHDKFTHIIIDEANLVEENFAIKMISDMPNLNQLLLVNNEIDPNDEKPTYGDQTFPFKMNFAPFAPVPSALNPMEIPYL